jgi:hypothetical protein
MWEIGITTQSGIAITAFGEVKLPLFIEWGGGFLPPAKAFSIAQDPL